MNRGEAWGPMKHASNAPPTDEEKAEMFEYLDELRESGVTNMFGARPYLRRAFKGLTDQEAGDVLVEWMRTFSERHPSPSNQEAPKP